MVRLGIGQDTLVVAYDGSNNLFGARLWWVLRHYGHANAWVLDGGWVAAGLPVTDLPAPDPEPESFTPRVTPEHLAETADLSAAMEDPTCQILDVRGDAEWLRQAPTKMSMAGHFPGALHIVWTDTIDPEMHCLSPAHDLRARCAALALRPQAEVNIYCQGGIRAAYSVLALTIAGFERIRNYEGSWAEWGRA